METQHQSFSIPPLFTTLTHFPYSHHDSASSGLALSASSSQGMRTFIPGTLLPHSTCGRASAMYGICTVPNR
ncbi:hypothetical protein E2C01_073146 [Portunus trituberculatus]|uniref:Uncharacterized protein n=1 Tax=Portunus trituberculatus TaxID=210409 RepID=A0A5B7I8N4_PORTR|nr:hypothetical protein [Portunus trituberculatus]